MNTKKTTQTFAIALAMILALAIAPTLAFSQTFGQIRVFSLLEEQANDLVGVWEEVTSALVDCQTREPSGPTIRVLYTFNQGGTMSAEDTFPLEGPYRTTGGGIWKRISGRNYTYVNTHYSFDPDKTFTGIVKIRANITLSLNSQSFTENGTVEIFDPNGNRIPEYDGCYSSTAHRLTF